MSASSAQSFTLYLGNKTYSSWSLRAWLAMKQVGAKFDEVLFGLGEPGVPTGAIREHSPSGRVPALRHGELMIWDSLAIGEYLAEVFPDAHLLPADRAARAVARSVVAEMHSGFAMMRTAMPMNVKRSPMKLDVPQAVTDDVTRIVAIWNDCRARFGKGGPFLFGGFSLADCAFAPVATRFRAYGVTLDATSAAYVEAIYAHPAMREWIDDAKKETWRVEAYEKVGM